ncbi:MAG: A/G-specific adenine glycosylase [Oscillospiraceae bacterium]|nr:A/G-specific adenine glycosylase [Oscillospiraceae bacterium]
MAPEVQRPVLPADLPQLLIPWYQDSHRQLPWRADHAPYHVWVSEIMLQQTRVEAVKGYYARFLSRLPDIPALAEVPQEELLKLWEGLGYYSRARNLQKAARYIMEGYGGVFPREYAQIRALPGIGDYTAGAICSICFDLPTPAVDGNVLRVVSRVAEYYGCTDEPAVKKAVTGALAEIYPKEAGIFTQSLMELGATVCVPNGQPLCEKCPLRECCLAAAHGTVDDLPIRAEKKKRRQEDMTVFLLTCGEKAALRKRPDKGLLAGLYEFPHLPGTLSPGEIIAAGEDWGLHPRFLEKLVGRKHIFTHIQWNMTGARLHCDAMNDAFIWVDRDTLKRDYALPTAFRQFLGDLWEESE